MGNGTLCNVSSILFIFLCAACLFATSFVHCIFICWISFALRFFYLHILFVAPLFVVSFTRCIGSDILEKFPNNTLFFLEDIPNGSFHTIFQCWWQLWSFSCDEGNPLPHWSCWGENMHWRSHSKKTALSLETFYPHGNHCGPCTDTVTLHRNHGNFPSSVETHLETILVLLSWGYPLIHHLQLPLFCHIYCCGAKLNIICSGNPLPSTTPLVRWT